MIRAGRSYSETDRTYHLRLALTACVALLLHVAIVSRMPLPWWSAQRPQAGTLGPRRGGAQISPATRSSLREQALRDAALFRRTALQAVEIEIVREHAPRRRGGDAQPRAPSPDPHPRSAAARETAPAGEPVVQIGEIMSVDAATRAGRQSERFGVVKFVRPEYPVTSQISGVSGVLEVMVRVDTTGAVTDVRLQSSEVDAYCEAAAEAALLQWRFTPYWRDGRTQPVLVPLRIRFTP